MTWFYHFARFTAGAFFKLLYGVKVYGKENLKFEGSAILASNHISLCDPPLIGSFSPVEIHFMAKSELFKNPLFGGMIKALNAFPVKRGQIDRAATARAMEILENGGKLLVFPEGTRQRNGVLAKGRPGSGKLAIETGVPIVPVCVRGANRLRKLIFSRRHIQIMFGKSIPTKDFHPEMPHKDRIRALTNRIMEEVAALQKELAKLIP